MYTAEREGLWCGNVWGEGSRLGRLYERVPVVLGHLRGGRVGAHKGGRNGLMRGSVLGA